MIERSETLQIMDQLELLILKKGWPVPMTPYYLVHHERMLSLMDQLRASLQDEIDGRFITSFAKRPPEQQPRYSQQKSQGKERSH
jgi:hypothetical protein